MSFPAIVEGTFVAIQVEDPANPGPPVTLCGLNSHTFTEQVNTRDRFLRDCATPGSIPIRGVAPTGKQWDLSGSGLYNRAQATLVSSLVGVTANYRFYIGEPADDAVYASYWEGPAMLTQRQITGGDDGDVAAELTFASDGLWVEVPVT